MTQVYQGNEITQFTFNTGKNIFLTNEEIQELNEENEIFLTLVKENETLKSAIKHSQQEEEDLNEKICRLEHEVRILRAEMHKNETGKKDHDAVPDIEAEKEG